MKHIYPFLFVICLSLPLTAQETQKKALDAFINATTKVATSKSFPVAGAELMIELLPGPKGTVITGQTGLFGIYFSKLNEVQGEEKPTITVLVRISPPKNFNFKYSNNEIMMELLKNMGPYYEYTLMFVIDEQDSSFGSFTITQNLSPMMTPDTNKIRGKGSAIKTGDSYQGEVRHF